MNYMDIKTLDIANGPGCRISLFVSGCRRHCEGCFNPESWDFCHGFPYTKETEQKILELLKPDYIEGLSILGGEPFEPENMPYVLELVSKVRKMYPNKSIWIYTGFEFQPLYYTSELARCIFREIDVLVDGQFQEENKDIALQFCGSTNQRVIDMPTTLATECIIVYDQYDYTRKKHADRSLCEIDD